MPEATAGSNVELPWFISVDDHVLEPPDVWTSRLASKFLPQAPHYERRRVAGVRWTKDGFIPDLGADGVETDVWVFGDVVTPPRRSICSVGLDRDRMTLDAIALDAMRPGCFEPKARLADMDLNHVEASLCFPQMIRFCGQEFSEVADKELGLACIRAYNDWMVEEWCGTNPKRLIPLIVVPLWDPELAAQEIYRNAERGVHAVSFSENPYVLGFQSIHSGAWDPFFRACEETQVSLNLHIGSSSKMQSTSPDGPVAMRIALTSNNASSSMIEFLFSGVLERYPALKIAFSESQIGWIPYYLERADQAWKEHRGYSGLEFLPEPPSFYYYRQMYGCFFRDYTGMRNLEAVGEDNVVFEVDYPHADSTWPDTYSIAREMLAGLTAEQQYKICRGNAIRLLCLDHDVDRR
jgi:predicted TIM-barrel fold metal-dependent hydrolase